MSSTQSTTTVGTPTRTISSQNGDIVNQILDNNGNVLRQTVVGSYLRDMTFNEHNHTFIKNGQVDREVEYAYTLYNGLSVIVPSMSMREAIFWRPSA